MKAGIFGLKLHINGYREGIEKWYYENGKLFSQVLYKNNRKQDVASFYDEEGNTIMEITFEDGIPTGVKCQNGKESERGIDGFWMRLPSFCEQ